MACPTMLQPPYAPPGWQPATLAPSQLAEIIPPVASVPAGASFVFVRIGLYAPAAGDWVVSCNADGSQRYAVVRAQVPGVYNYIVSPTPVYYTGGANRIYIQNMSANQVTLYVSILAYG